MPSHELTFGVFIPQGWKMELVSIEDPQAKWAKAVEVATLAEESGLDSLCFAIVVARLEDALGFDPFSAAEEVDFPVTLGDLIRFYEDGAN